MVKANFFDESFVAVLRRIVRKVDGIRGPGVSNTPEAIVINPQAIIIPRPSNDIGDDKIKLVKPTGTLTLSGGGTLSGGIYSARVWLQAAGSLSLTAATFNGTLLGTDPGADNAYFVNLTEMGQATHDLVSTASGATLALAINYTTAADGAPVFVGPLMFPGCS